MTTNLIIGEFDRAIFGLPYHGLWKAGNISLPNGLSKAAPTPENGTAVLVKVPGKSPVLRNASDQISDAAEGKEWRNYGLISGGKYGAYQVPLIVGAAVVIFVDGAGKVWRLKITKGPTNILVFSAIRFSVITSELSEIDFFSMNLSISVPPEYYNNLYTPVTLAQSSSGREFVLGSTMSGQYPSAMLKVSLSGNVDFTRFDLGLAVSCSSIEYPGRTSFVRNYSYSIAGKNKDTTRYYYRPVSNTTGQIVGEDYIRTIVEEDGNTTSDNGDPAPLAGVSWNYYNSARDHSTSKQWTMILEYVFERILWVGYSGDDLKVLTVNYSNLYNETATPEWVDPGTGVYKWLWAATSASRTVSESITFRYGETIVSESSRQTVDSQCGAVYMQESSDSTVVVQSPIVTDALVTGTYFNYFSSGDYREYPGVFPLGTSPGQWTSPLVVKGVTRSIGSTKRVIPESVWAPSGTSEQTSNSYSQLFASWHPVFDQIAIDTQKICWF